MRAARWFPHLVLACSLLLWALPVKAQLYDLEGRIAEECGKAGFQRNGGCRVELPRGTLPIGPTKIGDCTKGSGGVQNSVTLVGQGPGMMTQVPRFPTAGTTIQYAGPAGQPMLEVCGSYFSLRDVAMDGAGASHCLRITANNAGSAISRSPEIEDVVLDGCGTAIEIEGTDHNDQIDLVNLERVVMRNVDRGYVQDSGQTVGNDFRLVESTARLRSYEIRGGSFVCRSCYAGQIGDSADYIGFYFTRSERQDGKNLAHHQATIETSHMEVRTGRFIVADHTGNRFPLNLRDNSFQQLCVPKPEDTTCEMTVVDVREDHPVLIHGNVFLGSNPTGKLPTPRMCSREGWRSSGNMVMRSSRQIAWGCR